MSRDNKISEKLAKLAEEAKHDAETTQDPDCRRDLRLVALRYKRLAEFSRTHPDETEPLRGREDRKKGS